MKVVLEEQGEVKEEMVMEVQDVVVVMKVVLEVQGEVKVEMVMVVEEMVVVGEGGLSVGTVAQPELAHWNV